MSGDKELSSESKQNTERIIIPPPRVENGGLSVAAAIITAAVILVFGMIGYSEFKQYRAAKFAQEALNSLSRQAQASLEQNARNRKAMEQKAEKERIEMERRIEQARINAKLKTAGGIDEIREKQLAELRKRQIEERKRREREDCEFWKEQERMSPTQGNRHMVKTSCK